MRRITAIVLVATLVIASADTVRAAPQEPPKFRNPIEWLFNDIGKLLSSAGNKLAGKSEAETEPAQEKATEATPGEPPATQSPVAAAEPASNTETPALAANETGNATSFRNPISWLFSDLARIFQPDLEIEQAPAASADVKPAVETAPAPVVTAEPAAEPQMPEIAAETEATPDAAVGTSRPSNPISWLFRDLARLFAPVAQETETAAADAITAVALSNPEPAPKELARDTADIEPQTTVELATAEPVEIGPWVPHPKNDPFDPKDSLFASNGTPLLAAPAPARADVPEPETVTVADVAPAETVAEPTIRKRAPFTPERRNRAALGQDHKAITPDPDDGTFVDRLFDNIFGIDEPVEAEETIANKVSDRIVPEEKLDLGYAAPDAPVPDRQTTRLEDGPIIELDLYLGRDSAIGAPYDAAGYKSDSCVERALHGSVFCLKNLNWPAEIASSFSADTAFLLPGEGVVRYENGVASRVYAVFNAQDFAKVVKFMQQRFGPPQEREIGWMHMLEAPKLPNTTFRWQAFSADRRDAIILEVRNYDDLRRSFADMEHGMVRLYRNGSRPIFKHISTMDLMLLQRRRVARAPVEVNSPPKQQ